MLRQLLEQLYIHNPTINAQPQWCDECVFVYDQWGYFQIFFSYGLWNIREKDWIRTERFKSIAQVVEFVSRSN